MKKLYTAAVLSAFLLSSCSAQSAQASKNIFAMDTYMTMTAYGQNADKAISEAVNGIYAIEAEISVTDENSEIYMINHSSGQRNVVSDDTAAVLTYALDMCRKTGGALDISLYPLQTAWGFTTDSFHVPDESLIEKLLDDTGYENVITDSNSVYIPEGYQLDLGAVGKGFAADTVSEIFRDNGIESGVLDFGGNIQTIGTRPDGSMWSVGIRSPFSEGIIGKVSVSDCAVVTSGGYERNFTAEDGTVYSHILDPQNGRPVDNDIASVTVIGTKGTECDALSTALYVMGTDKAADYLRDNGGFEMIIICDDSSILISTGLKDRFELSEQYKDASITVI